MHYKTVNMDRLFEPKTFYSIGKKQSMTGVDTEMSKSGDIVLIASDTDYMLDRSGIKTYEALPFLAQYRHNIVWFYNLQFDFDAIMKSSI